MSIIMNKKFNEEVSEFIFQMFAPQWSPTEDNARFVEVANQSFAPTIGKLTGSSAPASVTDYDRRKYSAFRTFYAHNRGMNYTTREGPFHEKNYIFGAALVNESFLNLLNTINVQLRTGAIPEFFVYKPENPYNPVTDLTTVKDAEVVWDENGLLTISDLVPSNSSGSCTHIKMFEDRYSPKAGTTTASGNLAGYVESQSVPELLMRLLFSIEADNSSKINYKRALAYKILIKLGFSVSMIDDAFKCFFHFDDYNTTKLTKTFTTDGKLEIEYADPIKLSGKYVKTIHNPAGQQLYIVFPFINCGTITNYAPKIVYETTNFNSIEPNNVYVSGDFFSGNIDPQNTAFIEQKATQMPTITDKFVVDALNKSVVTLPYTAVSIGQVGTGAGSGTGSTTIFDLEFDKIDKIDYLDGFKISIQTPYIIN
jgi:hypothetical protein